MGRHKQELCSKGLHELKGFNAIEKADGSRQCRACTYAQRNKRLREDRKLLKELREVLK